MNAGDTVVILTGPHEGATATIWMCDQTDALVVLEGHENGRTAIGFQYHELAYPDQIPQIKRRQIDREIVNLLLEYTGTPREDLFEYPHREDDSIRYIRNAESLAQKIETLIEKKRAL